MILTSWKDFRVLLHSLIKQGMTTSIKVDLNKSECEKHQRSKLQSISVLKFHNFQKSEIKILVNIPQLLCLICMMLHMDILAYFIVLNRPRNLYSNNQSQQYSFDTKNLTLRCLHAKDFPSSLDLLNLFQFSHRVVSCKT